MKLNRIGLCMFTLLSGLSLFSCEEHEFNADVPATVEMKQTDFIRLNKIDGDFSMIHNYDGKPIEFEVSVKGNTSTLADHLFTFDSSDETLAKLKKQFDKLIGVDIYSLLPHENYTLPEQVDLKKGNEKVTFKVAFKDIPVGNYVLPICLKEGNKEIGIQFIKIVNPSDESLDISTYINRTISVEQPRVTAIVEAKENDLRNVGNYYVTYKYGVKRPLFDMTVIFSANMNWDKFAGKPVLFLNDDVTKILSNREVFIAPLQKKGIKVLISIMPNRQGIGFSNMSLDNNHQMITDFAKQIADLVKKYQLDGVMFDDEYGDYPQSPEAVLPGRGMVQLGSFHYLVKELRDLMPINPSETWKDRHNIITFYNLGINSSAMTGERGWCLFANDFDMIKNRQGKWSDGRIEGAARKAMRDWVRDPANSDELEKISAIKVGELFDVIWNGNYLRGDDFIKSNEGPKREDGWFSGLDRNSAKDKFGLAAFEMSLEIDNDMNRIQHQKQFWELGNYPEPGRGETRENTMMKQRKAEEKNLMFFNLSYIPDTYNGNVQKNFYLNDIEKLIKLLGDTSVKVTFDGVNYDTIKPSYLK